MPKRLTDREKNRRDVELVVVRIVALEKRYGIQLTRAACIRYYQNRGEELKLKREIAAGEKRLAELKKKARRK